MVSCLHNKVFLIQWFSIEKFVEVNNRLIWIQPIIGICAPRFAIFTMDCVEMVGSPIDRFSKSSRVLNNEIISVACGYLENLAWALKDKGVSLAWRDFPAPILSIFIKGAFIHDRIHDRVIAVPIQFAIIFRGNERPFELHCVSRFSIRPRVSNAKLVFIRKNVDWMENLHFSSRN